MVDDTQNTPVQSPAEQTPPVQSEQVNPPKSNRNMIILFSGVLSVAVVILAAAGYFYFRNSKPNYSYNNQYTAQGNPSPTLSPAISAGPSPVSSVSSSKDLNSVMNELNATTDKDLQNDYNQANSQGSNF